MSHEPVRVLLVEDNMDDAVHLRRVLRQMLTSSGLDFRHEEDGSNLLETIDSFKPDVVLLDHQLPGKTGLELLRDLSARRPFVPVVLVTGVGDEQIAVQALQAGARDYITKHSLDGPNLVRALFRSMAVSRYEAARRSADARTEKLSNTLDAVLDNVDHGIVILDRHLGVESVNKAGLALLGWEAGDVMGRDFHNLTHRVRPMEEAHDPFTCPLDTALSRRLPKRIQAEFLCRSDGTFVAADVSMVPMPSGPEGSLMVVLNPILQPTGADAELTSLRKVAQERTDLLNLAGHIINTPMTPLMLRIRQLSKMVEEDAASAHVVESIERGLARLKSVFEATLMLTRIKRGLYRIKPAENSVNAIIFKAIASHEKHLKERQVEIVHDVDEVTANIDSAALNDGLSSLLQVAIHRSEPDGRILLSLHANASEFKLKLQEFGVPLSSEDVRNMMDPFGFMVSDTTSGEDVEKLLGLHIARLICEAHGGVMDIDASGGTNSYSMRIPLEGPQERLARSPASWAQEGVAVD